MLNQKETIDFKKISISDIGPIRMCRRIFKSETSERGDIPFYKIGTFGGIPDSYISLSMFNNYKRKYPFPTIGSILISAAGTIGRTVIYNGEDSYFQDSNIVWIENNQKIVLNSFLYYYLALVKWPVSDGGSVKRLYSKEFLKLDINIPPLPEQKKIAEILSTWDEAIELTQKKHSNLLLLKKGVAQKIINSPEWKKVPIRSLLKKKSVMSVPNSNQYLEIGDVDISTKKYTLKEKPPVKGAVLAPKGSILISTVRPTRGAITMISDNFLVSSAFVIVDLLPTISKTFIFSQLNSEKFLNNMGRLSTGSTYPTVNREDVLSYKVLVPPIEEQDSISEVMDNLTKSLSLLENKINLLKLQKQGLMQRLLTGKVRVKLD